MCCVQFVGLLVLLSSTGALSLTICTCDLVNISKVKGRKLVRGKLDLKLKDLKSHNRQTARGRVTKVQ